MVNAANAAVAPTLDVVAAAEGESGLLITTFVSTRNHASQGLTFSPPPLSFFLSPLISVSDQTQTQNPTVFKKSLRPTNRCAYQCRIFRKYY